MRLQRLILTFGPEGVEIRTLYRSEAGPNPGTKARTREVAGLVRTGSERRWRLLRRPWSSARESTAMGLRGWMKPLELNLYPATG